MALHFAWLLTLILLAQDGPAKPARPEPKVPTPTTPAMPGKPQAAPSESPADLAALLVRVAAARQKIERKETGADTQAEQKAALSLLDRLIAVAEQQEAGGKNNPGQGGGSSSGGDQKKDETPEKEPPQSEEEQEKKPQGSPEGEPRPGMARGAGGDWGRLRDQQREAVLNVLREKFPARYRQLIDQYYQRFQDERR